MRGHGPAVADAVASDAAVARARIRSGEHTAPTSGLAAGFAQANLVILPADDALDFMRFCVRNPKPCPLLEVTDTGSPHPTTLAHDADLRTDLPRYRVFQDGSLVDEPTDVTRYWRDDLVSFLLGCSFTFEWALAAAGLPLAHQLQGVNVPMYVTNRRCVGAGPFEGPLVVSMRPFAPADIASAVDISSRFPAMHGGPVHIGDPAGPGHRRSGARPTTATRCGSARRRCRCSGRAGSHRRRSPSRPSRRWPSFTHPATCSSPIDRTRNSTPRRGAMAIHDEHVSHRGTTMRVTCAGRCAARR